MKRWQALAGAAVLALCGCSDDSSPRPAAGAGGASASASSSTGVGGTGGEPSSAGSGGMPDAAGDPIWSRRGDGLSSARAVAVSADGSVGVAGVFRDALDFGAGSMVAAGQNDAFVAAFDDRGACRWTLGFSGIDDDAVNAIAVDGTGNWVVAGSFRGTIQAGTSTLTSEGGADVLVASISSEGELLWAHRFGGAGSELGFGIAVRASGLVVVSGEAAGPVDFGGGVLQGAGPTFVLELDGAGNHVSSRLFEGISTNALGAAPDGHVLLGGSFSDTIDLGTGPITSAASTDAVVASFDEEWLPVFVARVGDGEYATAYAVASGPSSSVVLGGQVQGEGLAETMVSVDRFSPSGELLWSRRFGTAEYAAANSVAVDGFENVILAGMFRRGTIDFGCGALETVPDEEHPYAGDMLLVKLDPDGECLWSKAFGGPGAHSAWGTAADGSGSIAAVGEYQDHIDFGLGPLEATYYPEAFVARFTP